MGFTIDPQTGAITMTGDGGTTGTGGTSPQLAGLEGLGITPDQNIMVNTGQGTIPLDYSTDPEIAKLGYGDTNKVGGASSAGNQQSEQDLLLNFLKLPSDQVTTFQQELADAGLLVKKSAGGVGVDYREGDGTDPTTLKAMQYVYAVASARGMTVQQALDYLKAHPVNLASGSGVSEETTAQMSEREYKDELVSSYRKIWGTPAPPGYIDKAMAAGMNIYEFIANEKNKPAYAHSPGYQYDRIQLQHEIASWMGALG
jgi:hypothetical protein